MGNSLRTRDLIRVLEILEQQGITARRLGEIVASGTLEDLCDPDAALGNRDALRAALQLTPLLVEPLSVTLPAGRTISSLIDAGHYHLVTDGITQSFTVSDDGVRQFEAKLFEFFEGYNSLQEIQRVIERESWPSEPVWRPARIEHLLAFGAKYPHAQLQYPVVAIGSSTPLQRYNYVPVLKRGDSGRVIDSIESSGRWPGFYRFLAVREVPV